MNAEQTKTLLYWVNLYQSAGLNAQDALRLCHLRGLI